MRSTSLAVALGALTLIAGCTGTTPATTTVPPPGGVLTLTPSTASYAAGEQVVLTLAVTNTTGGPCLLSREPDGVVTVLSLTRDGRAVLPGTAAGTTIDGFTRQLRAGLTTVAPGASVRIPLAGVEATTVPAGQGLELVAAMPPDEVEVSQWPVDAPGRYAISVRYVPPVLPDPHPALCPAPTAAAQTEFTVG